MERQKFKPPNWCSRICVISRSNACQTDCARHRDARYFIPIASLDLEDMPPFPFHDFKWGMSAGERLACIGIYTAKMVERHQGESACYEGDSDGYTETQERIRNHNVYGPEVWQLAIDDREKK
jgi:hypothetical protein